jgi:hypothetical protein
VKVTGLPVAAVEGPERVTLNVLGRGSGGGVPEETDIETTPTRLPVTFETALM